ncbi:MAG: hypothetical protein KDK26_08700 [Roseivivax sp.]|nr:hypothetical protein [Roseivivax sp.]
MRNTNDKLVYAMRDAARRCDDYLTRWGIEAKWTLNPIGLVFEARDGAQKIEKWLAWSEVARTMTLDNSLKNIEEHALQGLSS